MPSFVFCTEKNHRVMLYIRRILEGLCAYCPQSPPTLYRITRSAPKRSLVAVCAVLLRLLQSWVSRAALLQDPLLGRRPGSSIGSASVLYF
jgi:hypothetical protein